MTKACQMCLDHKVQMKAMQGHQVHLQFLTLICLKVQKDNFLIWLHSRLIVSLMIFKQIDFEI